MAGNVFIAWNKVTQGVGFVHAPPVAGRRAGPASASGRDPRRERGAGGLALELAWALGAEWGPMGKLIPVLREAVRLARPQRRQGPACALFLLDMQLAASAQVPVNTLPIRLGADQQGHNAFRGEMAAVRIYERPLAAEEVKRQAGARPDAASRLPGLVAEWLPGGLEPGKPLPGGGRLGPAAPQGAVQAAVVDGVSGGRFAGGYLAIPASSLPVFASGCTLEAWIRPAGGAGTPCTSAR